MTICLVTLRDFFGSNSTGGLVKLLPILKKGESFVGPNFIKVEPDKVK